MRILKRFIYLGYYFNELDWDKLRKFMKHVSVQHHVHPWVQWTRIIYNSLRYNISILEYFLFHFYEISHGEKDKYAGTGFMYEYQLRMNPKFSRSVLENKINFLQVYGEFVKRKYASIQQLINDISIAKNLLGNTSGKVVLKDSFGQCGVGVEVVNTKSFTFDSLLTRMRETKKDLIEEFVVQHDTLMKLSPSGLNTIRIITQLNQKDEVELIGARLRITVDSAVDNLAAGNLAAPIATETGVVEGPGVYSDITKKDEYKHPVTGVEIPGLVIPFWSETIQMVKQAALINMANRSIGWDVAITKDGPEIIEGNHNWCKLLWQLPVKKGLKPILISYL